MVDLATSELPIEVFVVDALWKLARLYEVGLVDEQVAATLRAELLARVPALERAEPDARPAAARLTDCSAGQPSRACRKSNVRAHACAVASTSWVPIGFSSLPNACP